MQGFKFSHWRQRAGALLGIAMGLAATTVVQAACDAERGAGVANKCVACHSLDNAEDRVGPSLLNIIDRSAASVEGFKYSRALRNLELIWTADNLDKFLAAPQKFARGNSMAFSGLRKPQDRADVICFFQSQNKLTKN